MGKQYWGSGRFNRPLYELRMSRNWTQRQMAIACGGYDAHTVNRVERGISYGNIYFWIAVKEEFNIDAEDMWLLQTGNPKFNVDKYKGSIHIQTDKEFKHHGSCYREGRE